MNTFRVWALLSCFLGFITSEVFAQQNLSTTNKKAINAYQDGLQALQERKIDEAFQQFEEAIERDNLFAEAYYQLGRLYEQNRQFGNAILNYEKSYNSNQEAGVANSALQFLGNLYMRKGEYQKAKAYLELLLPRIPAANNLTIQRIKRSIANAEFALRAVEQPLDIKPIALPNTINAFDTQYFPTLTADRETLIFTAQNYSNRDENLYVSKWKDQQWQQAQSLSELINTSQNEGTASVAADGRTLVFTACGGRNGFGSCDLFVSYREGNDWTKPMNMGQAVNSGEWDSQPSLSADGRTLYFVSDRRGSIGKRDIWVSKQDSTGQWQKAQNVGNTINTTEDDLSPFIHANGQTLFFSSEGHAGMGGLDLFMSQKQGINWSAPQNLGYPINTQDDQVALFITADGQKGYYSLEQDTGERYKKSKLVEITLPNSLQAKIQATTYLKGIVTDAKTQQKLSAELELVALNPSQTVGKFLSDAQTGQYISVLNTSGEYALFVNKQGYFFKSLHFDFSQTHALDKVLNISLEPIQKDAKEILNNIFFATNQWDLQPQSTTELDKLVVLLKSNPTLSVEISGHTDDVGKDADNLILSQKRAKEVMNYLVNKGIPSNKIKAEGYGETKPFVPNTSDENRKLNRRIEVKFL
ncbi:OmpA family protein [Emticicia sp. ODNR4P]|nr:OmpA family protein [Emticicia sp. ODNR4P]